MPTRQFRRFSAFSGVVGVLMILVSFFINPGPPADVTAEQLTAFGAQHFSSIVWGAWLQAVGPVLIMIFAFAIVSLAGATDRLSGLLTMFGGTILVMVSLLEITFYFGALFSSPPTMSFISMSLGHAVQHLYFIVAAPALFLPLGVVIVGSRVLPRAYGYVALLLGAIFAIAGVMTLSDLIVPVAVQAFAGVQALWWLAAAFALVVQREPIPADDLRQRVA